MLTAGFDALAKRAVTQPIARPVPADDAALLTRKGTAKLAFRMLRRQLELTASGQRDAEQTRIDPAWRRALWIHAEAPQIGDALMDLAPRTLFLERGLAVDLLAPPATAALFSGDRGFACVVAAEAAIEPARYDFVIVDSRSWKALAVKRRRLPALPWVSIKVDYLGYDYHRGLFAARRLMELLGMAPDDTAERVHSRQKLLLPTPSAGGEPARLALALGGVRDERRYAHWPAVAALLRAGGIARFVLLGSANARDARDAVLQRLAGSTVDVLDLVERTDLHGAWRAMSQSTGVACADGGLMHLALATTVPVVALFDTSIDPVWRLPLDFSGTVLRADVRDVSAIAPEQVAAALLSALR